MGKPLEIATALMGLLFVLGAVVQWNDPDPMRWVLIYLAAAASCAAFRRVSWGRFLALSTAVSAIAWGARIVSEMPRWVKPSQMFEPMESRGGAVELAREVWGLGLLAAWMLLLVWQARPRQD